MLTPSPDGPSRERLDLDTDVIRQHGITAALVLDAILSWDNNMPTYIQIAEVAGVSRATVKRSIGTLRDDGMLKWQQRFQNNKQVSNSYQVPTSKDGLMGGQNDPPIYISITEEEDSEEEVSEVEEVLDVVQEQESLETTTSRTPRIVDGSQALGFAQCGVVVDSQGVGESVPRNFNGLVLGYQASVVVDAFAEHVRKQSKPNKDGSPRKIGSRRMAKFHDTAFRMVYQDRRPLAEILDVVDHAFAYRWHLANVMDGAIDTGHDWDRGLTRLSQVRDFYPEILAHAEVIRRRREPGCQVLDFPDTKREPRMSRVLNF